ncbi:MAG TPA: hypothetical protein VHP33_18720, partial [Polyangiaceae bacterium]|nr:hypothetical protein [Polyangiaceae bacterium]
MRANRSAALVFALGLLGCGRQDLDLLVKTQAEDPCLAFESEAECRADATLGCSFQPNVEGCLSTDPNCRPGLCRGGDPYVRRGERSFFLNGAPFRFVGVSTWALVEATQCTSSKPEDLEAWMQRAFDELVPSGAKVARVSAFQSSAGLDGTDFALFDTAVRFARRAGVRLQFVLEHAQGNCSVGGRRESSWYASGYEALDGNYMRSYRQFAEDLADYYRFEPTVLGYVLLQGLGGADTPTLTNFATNMGKVLHGAAPNQLMSLDLTWEGADSAADYRALQELSAVDLIDVDDYQFQDSLEPLDPVLLETLSSIDKPVVVGEGAFLLDGDSDAALARRAQKTRERMAAW